ncbi:SGNH/GDSL hydrolase family protein [Sphingomonas sp. SORGH_AS_0879]|uniref:SGNH/GDSL hydrolase family protein n=1 Tax=Sphingomonas sp. SORGH_AS_0879 TaxID=3041790 RepID=UPI002780C270|nr:SGNH/GDSL hydrolase family protein [Sphingomonas sp. SORGH_AS_0879]MDQ1232136.1 acyl-CoA thioesterase-1 [Sphingomonas sp. SORGH_AS_0879]
MTVRSYCRLALLVGALLSAGPVPAQETGGDWAALATYRQRDTDLIAGGAVAHRVVFMGDSITEGWDRDHQSVFADPLHINRGISGQTTAQMLVRFRQDVVALHPETVILLGGTNDIAGNGGEVDDATIRGHVRWMVELARANGIRVVLVSILPTNHYWWAPQVAPAARIADHNRWLRDYAARMGLTFVDAYAAMLAEAGAIDPGLSGDGVHPNAAGYAVMERVLRPVLGQGRRGSR